MQNRSRLSWLLLPALAGLFTLGCSDSSSPRSVVRVDSINENQPLQSDVVESSGSQYSVMEDAVLMTVSNEPHDASLSIDPDGPFGRVVLERYTINFECEESIQEVSGALGWIVPSGEQVSGSIVIVPAQLKLVAPLVALISAGEIQATAHVTVYGREATSDDEVRFEASLPVHFANWAK